MTIESNQQVSLAERIATYIGFTLGTALIGAPIPLYLYAALLMNRDDQGRPTLLNVAIVLSVLACLGDVSNRVVKFQKRKRGATVHE